jgi:phage tail sheath protein FI
MGMITGDAQKDVVNYRKYQLNANTRNLELYTTHQLVYDEFNDRNIYVSPSCFVASRIMSVAQEYGWHWAAAGYNRGVINSLDVAKSFEPSIVDTFSDAQINTIIKEPGMGNVIFDELTLLSKASDLQDAHNSRYVDIYLRPRLKDALKQFLFEFNDEQTRMLIIKMLDTFMQPEVSARALYNYKVVCDDSNNRPRDIQNNICNVWIFVQLMKLAKFIPVKIIVSPYGVSFDDLGYTG